MASLISFVCEFSELLIFVNCITFRKRTKSRYCILLRSVHLQLHSEEDDFTGTKKGVVTDVSEAPVWPGEPSCCDSLLYSHPVFCIRRKEPSLAGRGRPGNLWRNSSVLIYGRLYMEIMMLLQLMRHIYIRVAPTCSALHLCMQISDKAFTVCNWETFFFPFNLHPRSVPAVTYLWQRFRLWY